MDKRVAELQAEIDRVKGLTDLEGGLQGYGAQFAWGVASSALSGASIAAAASEVAATTEPEPQQQASAAEPQQTQQAAASAAPAGWYADPSSRYELRYWDGTQWTEHVSRSGQQFTDPPVA